MTETLDGAIPADVSDLAEEVLRLAHEAQLSLAAADIAEVLLAMDRGPPLPADCEMDKPRLVVGPAASREPRDRGRDIRVGGLKGPLRHRPGDGLGHRAVEMQGVQAHAEQLVLGVFGIGHEAALERVGVALDVGEQG